MMALLLLLWEVDVGFHQYQNETLSFESYWGENKPLELLSNTLRNLAYLSKSDCVKRQLFKEMRDHELFPTMLL